MEAEVPRRTLSISCTLLAASESEAAGRAPRPLQTGDFRITKSSRPADHQEPCNS